MAGIELIVDAQGHAYAYDTNTNTNTNTNPAAAARAGYAGMVRIARRLHARLVDVRLADGYQSELAEVN